MIEFDESNIAEFIAECRDHLSSIEPDLISLEKDGVNVALDTINRIFRAMHSIKGSSSFFGFEALTKLSHGMENVLVEFREGKLTPNSGSIDYLLLGADKIKVMIGNIYNSNEISYNEELEKLNSIISKNKQENKYNIKLEISEDNNFLLKISVNEELLDDAVFKIDKEKLLSILDSNLDCYAFWINVDKDLKDKGQSIHDLLNYIESLGKCIVNDSDKGNKFIHLLFETIIEKDIIYDSLETDDKQLIKINKKFLDPSKVKKPRVYKEEKKETKIFSSSETIRVHVELMDRLMNLASELVLGRNQLRKELEISALNNSKLITLMKNVDIVTSEIQEEIMQMRMQSSGSLLNKFKRVVRDLSKQLNKEVDLIIEGSEVELDRSILEGLSDPLMHLIRNCMDHGIESSDIREKIGKSRYGTISLRTFHEAGQVNILVKDDGSGIDVSKLTEKAIENEILSKDKISKMSDVEKLNLIFLPGLSTSDEITDISGRGVGMDVVKTNIEKLGGHIEIGTEIGIGTSFRIRLPLTLAIIPSLIVGDFYQRFAIPQVNIKELVLIKANDTKRKLEKIGNAEVLRLREKLLPIVRLSDVLGLDKIFADQENGEILQDRRERLSDRRSDRRDETDRRKSYKSDINVVVLKIGLNFFGLAVNELFDYEEIVVKPLSTHIKDCKCFSGATIMGDGKVAMIIDASGIAEFAKLRFNEIASEEIRRAKEAEKNKLSLKNKRSMLVFNNALSEYFAINLANVLRLEFIKNDIIHVVGNHKFIEYRGKGLPLIYLESFLPVGNFPKDLKESYIIIPKNTSNLFGIIASNIIDAFETDIELHKDTTTNAGLLGTAFLEGHFINFIDIKALVEFFERVK